MIIVKWKLKGRLAMSQEIEIEFKNLVSKEEFDRLKHYFNIEDNKFVLQKNHYFDTESFSLKKHNSALRVRQKGNSFELTLKQPLDRGVLETNQILNDEEATKLIHQTIILDGEIKDILEQLQINPGSLNYFGTLSTRRAELPYKNGLLVLDHSSYLNTEDYEIEYEVNDEEEGKEIFLSLLTHLKIKIRKTENKIKRFYNQKFLQNQLKKNDK